MTAADDATPDPTIGEGEPLPVGAHDPDLPDVAAPPGLPTPPDDVDEQIARLVNAIHNDGTGTYSLRDRYRPRVQLRPDQASLTDAFREQMYPFTAHSSREALLALVQSLRGEEREAAMDWAKAVRGREEARDRFVRAQVKRRDAMSDFVKVGAVEDDEVTDIEQIEAAYPKAIERKPIDDAQIV